MGIRQRPQQRSQIEPFEQIGSSRHHSSALPQGKSGAIAARFVEELEHAFTFGSSLAVPTARHAINSLNLNIGPEILLSDCFRGEMVLKSARRIASRLSSCSNEARSEEGHHQRHVLDGHRIADMKLPHDPSRVCCRPAPRHSLSREVARNSAILYRNQTSCQS
jgi:hypothetical protein